MHYKLAWFLGFSLVIAPLAANAQKRGDTSARFGVKLGLTITTLGGEDADDLPFAEAENKLGFAVGGLAEFALSPVVSLQPELLVVSKGAELEVLGGDAGHFSYTYLEIPILVRLNLPVGESVAPFAVVGPGVGILVSAKYVNNDGDSENIKDDTNSLDLGLIIGGGLGVPLSSGGALDIEVRYERGLVAVDDDPDTNLDIENRAIFVLGGYRF